MFEDLPPFSFPSALCRTILPRYLIRDEESPAFWAYHCPPPILHQVINGVLELTAKLETHVARVTINYGPPGWEAPIGFPNPPPHRYRHSLFVTVTVIAVLFRFLLLNFRGRFWTFPEPKQAINFALRSVDFLLWRICVKPEQTAKTLGIWVLLTPHKSQQNAKVDQRWPHIMQFTSEIMCHLCPILV
jgi:hypothetical protein